MVKHTAKTFKTVGWSLKIATHTNGFKKDTKLRLGLIQGRV